MAVIHTQMFFFISQIDRWLEELFNKKLSPTGSDRRVLENDPVVDESDVLEWVGSTRSFLAQKVENLRGQHRVLTILYEFAQMSQTGLFGVKVFLDDRYDRLHNGLLVFESTLTERRRQNAFKSFRWEIIVGDLKQKQTSSLSIPDKNPMRSECLRGNFKHRDLEIIKTLPRHKILMIVLKNQFAYG